MPVCLLCCHSVRPSVRPVPVELAPPVVPLARSKSAPAGAALHSKASPSTPLEAQARVVQLGRQLSDDGQAHASGGLSPRTPSTDAAGGVASIWKAVQRMNSAGGDADVGQGADGPAWLPVGASSQPVDAALQRKLQLEQDVHITIGFLCDAAHAVSVDTIHARAAAKRQAKKDRQREAAEGVAGSASDGAQAASAAAEGAGAATGAGAGVGAGAGAGATAGAAAGAGGAGLESATPAAAGTTTTTTVAVALIKSLQARKARAHQRLEALQLATNKVAHILLHEGETPASVAKKHVSTEDSLPMLSVPDVLLCTELINGVAEGLCSPKIGKNMGGYLTGLEVRVGWGLGGLPQVQQCMTDPWRGFHCAGLRLGAGDAVAVHSARLLGHHGTPASLHCPARVAVRSCAHVDAAVGIARRLPVCRAAASASAAPALRVNAAGGSWKRRRSGACRAGRPPSHFRDCHHVRLRLCCCMRRILACRTRARAYACVMAFVACRESLLFQFLALLPNVDFAGVRNVYSNAKSSAAAAASAGAPSGVGVDVGDSDASTGVDSDASGSGGATMAKSAAASGTALLQRHVFLLVLAELEEAGSRMAARAGDRVNAEAPGGSAAAGGAAAATTDAASATADDVSALFSGSDRASEDAFDAHTYSTEALATYRLRILAAISGASHFRSPRLFRVLLTFVQFGSPRLRLLALRMLRPALASVEPGHADALLQQWIDTWRSDGDAAGDGAGSLPRGGGLFAAASASLSSMVDTLLLWVGTLSMQRGPNAPPGDVVEAVDAVVHAAHVGDSAFALCSELVMLLRWLLASGDQWRTCVSAALTRHIANLPSSAADAAAGFGPAGPAHHELTMRLVFGTLDVLGSHTDRVRAGGRVKRVTSLGGGDSAVAELGTVVSCDRLSNVAHVVFDSNPKRVLTCPFSKLTATPEVRVQPSWIAVSSDLLAKFLAYVKEVAEAAAARAVNFEKAEADAETAAEPAPAPAPAPAPSATVACVACTFENMAGMPQCQICGTPLPAAAPAPAPAPSTSDAAAEDAEEAAEELPPVLATGDLVIRQLQARTAKCLCVLLQDPAAAAAAFAHAGVLSQLLRAATVPARGEGLEFASLRELEEREQRLRELLATSSRTYHASHSGGDGCGGDGGADVTVRKVYQGSLTASRAIDGRFAGVHGGGVNGAIIPPLQRVLLPHCPFNKQQAALPSLLDRASCRDLTFARGDAQVALRTVRVSSPSGGVGHANHTISNNLPCYYFEMKVVHAGEVHTREEGDMARGFGVSLGLVREGLELSLTPGCGNSFAFCSDGHTYHSPDEVPLGQDCHQPFTSGDVVGCGWNLRTSELFFTLNGEVTAASFDNLSSRAGGRFFPAVWLRAAGATVQLNFGQEPFRYNFKDTVPEGFILTGHEEADGPVMGEAERARHEQAQTILAMFPYFPIQLIVTALEQNQDRTDIAANWLMEHGFEEMERLEEEIRRRSEAELQQRLEAEQLAAAGVEVNDGDGGAAGGADTGVEDWIMDDGDDGGEGMGLGQNSDPASWLDDQVDQDVPVGVDVVTDDGRGGRGMRQQRDVFHTFRQQRTNAQRRGAEEGSGITEGLAVNVEELVPGMVVCVTEAATVGRGGKPANAWMCGSVGVVLGVNVSDDVALVGIPDASTGHEHGVWFPMSALAKPTGLWTDPCATLLDQCKDCGGATGGGGPPGGAGGAGAGEEAGGDAGADAGAREALGRLCSDVSDTLLVLSVRLLRRVVLSLVSSWPEEVPFTLSRLGGRSTSMKMLKLAAGECLLLNAGKDASGVNKEHPLLRVLRARFQSLLEQECLLTDGATAAAAAVPAPLDGEEESKASSAPSGDAPVAEGGADATAAAPSEPSGPVLPPAPLRVHLLRQTSTDTEASGTDASVNDGDDDDSPAVEGGPRAGMTHLLAREAVRHFIRSAEHPPPRERVETAHPYNPMCDVRGCVYIPGAQKLTVTFDRRCKLSNDALTSLVFYKDEQCTDQLQRFASRTRWTRAVIEGNRFYYRFRSGPSAEWGYKFTVSPSHLQLTDSAALAGHNLELGVWLVDLLLTSAPSFFRYEYLVDVFDAVVQFAKRSLGAGRARGFELMVRLLQEVRPPPPPPYPARLIDVSKLAPIRREMNRVIEVERRNMRGGLQLHSAYLQSLVELMVAAQGGHIPNLASMPTSQPSLPVPDAATAGGAGGGAGAGAATAHDDTLAEVLPRGEVLAARVGQPRIFVHHATYGILNNASKRVDVTEAVRAMVKACGGSYLAVTASTLARDPAVVRVLRGGDTNSQQLRVWYQVVGPWSFVRAGNRNAGGSDSKASESDAAESDSKADAGHVVAATGGLLEPEIQVDTATGSETLYLSAKPSWFERVVQISNLATAVTTPGAELPRPFALAAFSLANMRRHGIHVDGTLKLGRWPQPSAADSAADGAGAEGGDGREPGAAVYDWGPAGTNFTVAFHAYIDGPPAHDLDTDTQHGPRTTTTSPALALSGFGTPVMGRQLSPGGATFASNADAGWHTMAALPTPSRVGVATLGAMAATPPAPTPTAVLNAELDMMQVGGSDDEDNAYITPPATIAAPAVATPAAPSPALRAQNRDRRQRHRGPRRRAQRRHESAAAAPAADVHGAGGGGGDEDAGRPRCAWLCMKGDATSRCAFAVSVAAQPSSDGTSGPRQDTVTVMLMVRTDNRNTQSLKVNVPTKKWLHVAVEHECDNQSNKMYLVINGERTGLDLPRHATSTFSFCDEPLCFGQPPASMGAFPTSGIVQGITGSVANVAVHARPIGSDTWQLIRHHFGAGHGKQEDAPPKRVVRVCTARVWCRWRWLVAHLVCVGALGGLQNLLPGTCKKVAWDGGSEFAAFAKAQRHWTEEKDAELLEAVRMGGAFSCYARSLADLSCCCSCMPSVKARPTRSATWT